MTMFYFSYASSFPSCGRAAYLHNVIVVDPPIPLCYCGRGLILCGRAVVFLCISPMLVVFLCISLMLVVFLCISLMLVVFLCISPMLVVFLCISPILVVSYVFLRCQ